MENPRKSKSMSEKVLRMPSAYTVGMRQGMNKQFEWNAKISAKEELAGQGFNWFSRNTPVHGDEGRNICA